MELSWLVTLLIAVLIVFLLYVIYMSSTHGTFRKMGIKGPTPWPVLGNFFQQGKLGMVEFQLRMYRDYRNEKVYGSYDTRKPILVVRDLDMIRDIMVKQFNYFVNRRTFRTEEPFDHAMTMIKDDHWKRVRNILSPTFSTAKLRRLYRHIETKSRMLRDNLREKQEANQEVELREVISCFTLDVIASTGFGIDINTLKDPENQMSTELKKIFQAVGRFFLIEMLFPFMWPILQLLGLGLFPKSTISFIKNFVDVAIENRNQEGVGKSSRHDFLQLMLEVQEGQGEDVNDNMTEEEAQALRTSDGKKTLSYLDIQGEAFIFILAGYDTVSIVMSFTLYLLALNPECLARVQAEIDEKLGKAFPAYDTAQALTYLDMCINESIRLYPPGFLLDRVCNADVDIQGVHIPKDMTVSFPVHAIHHDPEIWAEPEKFDPERFTPENKATRHPFAFLPFGQGPRNCIGMRLALLEMKVGLAAILQTLTPVTCAKTKHPIKLDKFQMRAEDGLWVKMEARKSEH